MKSLNQLRSLLKGNLVRHVSILVGGTAFAQLITLLVLPILTRIYTPEDFTILATYTSILALLTSIACLRFEIAIPLPKSDQSAIHIFVLCIISIVFVTLLTSITIYLGEHWINKITNQRLASYLWLLPIGVFFSGLYNALQYWMTREKLYPIIAKTRMTQSLTGATTQLGCGYAGITPLGLLIGQLFNSGAGVFKLSRYFSTEYRLLISQVNRVELKQNFRRYDRFPRYSTWEALTNSAAIQIPILIIASLALSTEAGFLMLAMRILSVPMGLIGSSISQVYLSEASERYHEGSLEDFTFQTVIILAKLAFIPLLAIGITAPYIIPLIFGSDWVRTGILTSWMAPWFFMQFITSPVSMSLHIIGKQKVALSLQITGLLIRGGAVLITAKYLNEYISEVFAISGVIFYSIYLFIILKSVKN